MTGNMLTVILRGLQGRYVRDLIVHSYELLKVVAKSGATIEQLHGRLMIEGYNRHQLGDLDSFLRALPASFMFESGHWHATGQLDQGTLELGIGEQSPGPRMYESPRGNLWHLNRDCEWLWAGKAKAAADGKQRHTIIAVENSSRPACTYCAGEVTYHGTAAQ